MSPRRRRSRGGGGAGNPHSLAQLKRGDNALPENRNAERHGGYGRIASRDLDVKAKEVFAALSQDAPLRGEDGALPAADAALVSLLARCLIRLERVEVWLRDYGELDQETGNPKPAVELEHRLRAEARLLLNDLGMSPVARAKLGLDLARTTDLASAMSEPDPARRARAMGALGLGDEDEDEEAGDA